MNSFIRPYWIIVKNMYISLHLIKKTLKTHRFYNTFYEGNKIFIKLNSYAANMFYAWEFSNNKAVPIIIQHKNCHYLDTHIKVFSWGTEN